MNYSYSKEIEYILLTSISTHREPVGAGFLFDMLQSDEGFQLSEATIGRYLRGFERQGFLKSEKYNGRSRGRVITEQGRERIRELAAEKQQTQSIADVMELLHNGLDQQLRNVLVTREIIEPEVAALAARNAAEEHLSAMRAVLEEMDRLTAEGKSMAATDGPFHMEIAKASGNPVLETIMRMIRADQDYSPEIEYIIHSFLRKVPSDHWGIYKAIEGHNPDKARKLMKRHIQNLIINLDNYENGGAKGGV